MAINYQVEWDKLMKKHGNNSVIIDAQLTSKLGAMMSAQIKKTIGKRESLMKEYIKSRMETDINGGNKLCYIVSVAFCGNVFGNVRISKKDFGAWCKKKKGGK